MELKIQIKGKSDAWDMSDLPRITLAVSVNAGTTHSNGLSCGYLEVDPGAELRFTITKSRKSIS